MFDKLRNSLAVAFEKITTTEVSGKKLDNLLWELQLALIQSDVAVDAAEAICNVVKNTITGEKIARFSNPRPLVLSAVRDAISNILESQQRFNLIELIDKKKEESNPFIIVFVGVNGTGKTTTIAKIAKYLLDHGYSVVLAASDTFRAGAVEQLTKHADKLGVRIVKHGYQADAAAVAFDAINHARARHLNVVLVDTAGRMQTNHNLMDEMKKIVRVTNPDLKVFVGDALAGNDALEQAQQFNNAIGLDGAILTKVDADAKGGAAVSISYAIKKPLIFIGTGQGYSDISPFNADWFIDKILPET
ncbi:MAG: signal recognition particle-docking protein FtsY [Candidatus Ranarchaeia archaeon]